MQELRVNDSVLEDLNGLEVEDNTQKTVEIPEDFGFDDLKEVAVSSVVEDEIVKVHSKPDYRKFSNSIEVVNTLGYSDKGTFTDITQNVLANAANSNPKIKVYPYTSATKGRGSNRGKTSWVKVDKKNGKILEGELYRRVDNNKFIVPYQYSEDGAAYNIVRRKGTSVATKNNMSKYRRCQTVPKIFGYIIANVGDEVVPMYTEEWNIDETGKFVSGGRIVVNLKPGEKMQISKTYLIMNASREVFDAKFKNGVIACSNKKASGTIEERFQHYFFKFSKESKLDVHSEDIKLQIADKLTHEDGSVEWVVKNKYLKTFGYMMNNRIIEKTKAKSMKDDEEDMNDSASRVGQTLREMLDMYSDDGGQL